MMTKSLHSANTGIHEHLVKHEHLLAFQNHSRWLTALRASWSSLCLINSVFISVLADRSSSSSFRQALKYINSVNNPLFSS